MPYPDCFAGFSAVIEYLHGIGKTVRITGQASGTFCINTLYIQQNKISFVDKFATRFQRHCSGGIEGGVQIFLPTLLQNFQHKLLLYRRFAAGNGNSALLNKIAAGYYPLHQLPGT